MNAAYQGREQTAAKHFILKRYLQALAFKLLQGGFGTLIYVDGFSGPWESKTSDYSDTSFMIAIRVLKDVQQRVREAGRRKRVQCFFVEQDAAAYEQLRAAVMQHHDPANDFFVHSYHGRFEDAVDAVIKVVGRSFALTFIDPTGWTGYEFHEIKRIMQHQPGEVLLNYMFDFINRFTAWDDPKISASFDGILGQNWAARLDRSLPREEAVQALFADEFRNSGGFRYVLWTPIEKLADRTHFCIVYGTRSDDGLATYRDVEFSALKDHGMRRSEAKRAVEEARTGVTDMFAAAGILPPLPIENQVPELCRQAREWLLNELREGGEPRRFGDLWPPMLAIFTIRKTNAKAICVNLAKEGIIHASWRGGASQRRTPDDGDLIELVVTPSLSGDGV